jgi:thiol-disulfide isomerase/thioredoxin
MAPIEPGATAPPVPGTDLEAGASLLYFYKVTCPSCQISAPVAARYQDAYPGHIVGVGQDPSEKLQVFSRQYGMSFPSVSDPPPYDVSDAYGIRTVPTLVLVNAGTVEDVVEAWDRGGFNRVSGRLARLIGDRPVNVSEDGDGLPPFRPG